MRLLILLKGLALRMNSSISKAKAQTVGLFHYLLTGNIQMPKNPKLLKYHTFIEKEQMLRFCAGKMIEKFPELNNVEIGLDIEFTEEGLHVCLSDNTILSLDPQVREKLRH